MTSKKEFEQATGTLFAVDAESLLGQAAKPLNRLANINDATLFGQIWNGTNGEGMNPDGTGGWEGEGLPTRPACECP